MFPESGTTCDCRSAGDTEGLCGQGFTLPGQAEGPLGGCEPIPCPLSPAPPLLLPVSHQEPPWECLEVFAAVAPALERTGAPKLSQALQVKGVCGLCLCPVPLPLLLSGDGLAVRAPSVTWARGRQCLSVAGLLPSSPSRLSLPFHTGAHRWVLLCTGQHSWAHIEPSRLGAPLLAGGPGTASLRKRGTLKHKEELSICGASRQREYTHRERRPVRLGLEAQGCPSGCGLMS